VILGSIIEMLVPVLGCINEEILVVYWVSCCVDPTSFSPDQKFSVSCLTQVKQARVNSYSGADMQIYQRIACLTEDIRMFHQEIS
jgi:hypothetical protein